MAYTEEYLIKKLGNCKNLIETATSDAQRTIYEGYLNFWIEKGYNKVEVTPETMGDIWKDVNDTIDKFDTIDSEAEFKAENPNRQAYYSRNGEMHITKAYKEFLNKETQ